ncbi:glycoside hydrolase [Lentzea sp. NBRC 105346]|uniref:glycoside hydrolase family 76 protein n=1 Tax=Lentzea sp. NBRC 105346 TaxID=3032205 RepID=UPI0024A48A4C|nr:glycoside hydrolase family 76 protein [Lentzea sp. NBRC 105346]GLZ33231.1 glycoside hydrolase [Lentzea sp. NBRC 105346]
MIAKLLAARAGVAERAVQSRHLRRVWGLPGTLLGTVAWPATWRDKTHVRMNYWWQAHLLDCMVDAYLRKPTASREDMVKRLVRGIRVRNLAGWTNDFYDDVAWLGLALLRAAKEVGVTKPKAINVIAQRLRDGWTDHAGGGIWWKRNDDFKNVPANGPAAIFLARLANAGGERTDLVRARSTVDWIEEHLVDPGTGLAWDGLHVHPSGEIREIEKNIYTYCQGVLLGACVEIAKAGQPAPWLDRAARVITGVHDHLAVDGVVKGAGGGDGGLFAGILVRYLAQAALEPQLAEAGSLAAELVYQSAEAAWLNRSMAVSGPLFGPEWSRPVVEREGRDLSIQLGGWMCLEAAALLERHDVRM